MARMSDSELWACAGAAIVDHGEDVADYLISMVQGMDQVRQHEEIGNWLGVIDRVAALLGDSDRPTLH